MLDSNGESLPTMPRTAEEEAQTSEGQLQNSEQIGGFIPEPECLFPNTNSERSVDQVDEPLFICDTSSSIEVRELVTNIVKQCN
jgi:hypothetical protein